MTCKQYKAIRKELVKLRELIGKAYNKSNGISQLEEYDEEANFELWHDVHTVTCKLWESYCAIDNEIIILDRTLNK